MASVEDELSAAQAYMFNYRFQVGHALRVAQTSRLRLECERRVDEVRLFLDAAGLVAGIGDVAEHLDTNLTLGAHELSSGDVTAIPLVDWRSEVGSPPPALTEFPLSGMTVSIPEGTEVGISPSPTPEQHQEALRIRFRHTTEIEIGVRADRLQKYELQGLRPVLLNGVPLLEVTSPQAASVRLQLGSSRTAILGIIGIVSPYLRRGDDLLYHLVEVVGDRVVGGTSIQIRF